MKLLGVIIGIGGFVVLYFTGGWLLIIGILLVVWGNNLERFN